VVVRARSEAVEISIEDDGEGITGDNLKRLFDPFFTTHTKGTGLGLAISRKIAREMGGDLYFEPKEPGARFVLVLKPGPIGEASA
jgi:signal transduction histidine kinase